MSLLGRLEALLLGWREAKAWDLTGDASIAICSALRKSGGGPVERPAPEPCPICGRGTKGGHQHVGEPAGVVPIRKVGG